MITYKYYLNKYKKKLLKTNKIIIPVSTLTKLCTNYIKLTLSIDLLPEEDFYILQDDIDGRCFLFIDSDNIEENALVKLEEFYSNNDDYDSLIKLLSKMLERTITDVYLIDHVSIEISTK